MLKDNTPHSFTKIDKNTNTVNRRGKWHSWLLIHCSCRGCVVYYDKYRLSQTAYDKLKCFSFTCDHFMVLF